MSLLGAEVVGWRPEVIDAKFHEIVASLIAGSLNGTDVSGWQPTNPPLTGDAFSIVKASEGVGAPNANWSAQVDWCRSAGALVGHYHFCNGLNTPQAEAQYFWDIVKTKWQVGEPIALDVEGSFFTNAANPVAWVLACAQELYALSGLKPIIYLDWSHEKNTAYNWQPLVDLNCGLWGAAYNSVGFGDPSPWPSIVIWQNADTNASGGDSDVLYGDASTFKAYGTPAGEDVALTPDDIAAVAAAAAKATHTYVVPHLDPSTGQDDGHGTTLAAMVGARDLQDVNTRSHVDAVLAAVKAISLTVTDAQVTELATLLIEKLPPAQVQFLGNQLLK